MLDGVWIPQAAEFGGGPVPVPGVRLHIDQNRYVMHADGGEPDRGVLFFGNAGAADTVDIVCETGAGAGRTIRAIWRRRGELLQLSYLAEENASRPMEFKTSAGSLQVLVRYRREE